MKPVEAAEGKDSRLGLRVLLGFVILYAAIYGVRWVMGVAPNLLMRQLGASPDFRASIGSTLNYGVGIAAYIVLPALALNRVLGVRPWPRFFPFRNGWWKASAYGFLLVTGVLALFFAVALRTGWLALNGWNWQVLSSMAWLRVAWVGLLINVGVAIGEETVFRGYLLTGLRAAWGRWMGLILMTLIFGLFHLPAYMANGMGSTTLTMAILLASLFGLLFGLVYLRTGTLWLPAVLHFTWNFVENDLLNMTADSSNPNLIGALTTSNIAAESLVAFETLAFCLIALGVGLWIRRTPV